jgi:hypothetical protein
MEDPHLNDNDDDQHRLLEEIVRVGNEKLPAGQEMYWASKETLKKVLQDELATGSVLFYHHLRNAQPSCL